jgi:hypothetical protein
MCGFGIIIPSLTFQIDKTTASILLTNVPLLCSFTGSTYNILMLQTGDFLTMR